MASIGIALLAAVTARASSYDSANRTPRRNRSSNDDLDARILGSSARNARLPARSIAAARAFVICRRIRFDAFDACIRLVTHRWIDGSIDGSIDDG
tara:strand:- start:6736 stop:7023 length:288 start_codon:yes stop_codon:yes gene_type:complete